MARGHIVASMTEFVFPSAHRSPQPKRYLNQFSGFCAVHVRVSLGMSQHALPIPFPSKLLLLNFHGWIPHSGPPLIRIPWAHPSPQPTPHLDWFSRLCTDDRSVPILYNGPPLHPKIAPSHGGCEPHLTHGSLGPSESSTKWHLDRFSHFCRAQYCDRQDEQMDRPTDHATLL